ncbi:MAG TPA: hypothetical protein VFQ68_44110, partial [Streptosporangiaceae bacterium]|nr:hypothetical protein [Streptosporangiaceae bacterium]
PRTRGTMRRWVLLKDILLTGTGMALVLSQVLSAAPSDVLLATGLALTVPSIAAHAGSLLAGRTGGPSSESTPPSPSPPSGSSSEAAGE